VKKLKLTLLFVPVDGKSAMRSEISFLPASTTPSSLFLATILNKVRTLTEKSGRLSNSLELR
jgi:hypothetical protein